MASTTFSGPVTSTNGFIGAFTGGTTNLALTGTLSVATTSTLTGVVTAPAGVVGDLTGDVTGNITGAVVATTLILPTATAAELLDEDDAINTTGKVAGKAVVDLSDGLIYVATGAGVNDKWVASDGTTDVTPV
jgi:hypothetical protein